MVMIDDPLPCCWWSHFCGVLYHEELLGAVWFFSLLTIGL